MAIDRSSQPVCQHSVDQLHVPVRICCAPFGFVLLFHRQHRFAKPRKNLEISDCKEISSTVGLLDGCVRNQAKSPTQARPVA